MPDLSDSEEMHLITSSSSKLYAAQLLENLASMSESTRTFPSVRNFSKRFFTFFQSLSNNSKINLSKLDEIWISILGERVGMTSSIFIWAEVKN